MISLVFYHFVPFRECLYVYDRHLWVRGKSRQATRMFKAVAVSRRIAGQLMLWD